MGYKTKTMSQKPQNTVSGTVEKNYISEKKKTKKNQAAAADTSCQHSSAKTTRG